MKVGIDVGGTFTDFLVTDEDGRTQVAKVLSTPEDPSVGLLTGLEEIARERGMTLEDFARTVTTIVHGTTVTTNVVMAAHTPGLTIPLPIVHSIRNMVLRSFFHVV